PVRAIIREEREKRVGDDEVVALKIGDSYKHHPDLAEHSKPLVVSEYARVLAMVAPNGPLKINGIDTKYQIIPETERENSGDTHVVKLYSEADLQALGKVGLSYEDAQYLTKAQLDRLGVGFINDKGQPQSLGIERAVVGGLISPETPEETAALDVARQIIGRAKWVEEGVFTGAFDELLDLPEIVRDDPAFLALFINPDLTTDDGLEGLQAAGRIIEEIGNQLALETRDASTSNAAFNVSERLDQLLKARLGINDASPELLLDALDELESSMVKDPLSEMRRAMSYEIPDEMRQAHPGERRLKQAVEARMEYMMRHVGEDIAGPIIDGRLKKLFPQTEADREYELFHEFRGIGSERATEKLLAMKDGMTTEEYREALAYLNQMYPEKATSDVEKILRAMASDPLLEAQLRGVLAVRDADRVRPVATPTVPAASTVPSEPPTEGPIWPQNPIPNPNPGSTT
ncbi:MAG TPA: hypothetical protein VEW42_01455, partial [Candidatus Eisenbacteria bacterium]|nr:hypothetical protein [Candidatus Eisenbacteria bacterium]